MLKSFKLNKKEQKKNITVADISGPTSSGNDVKLKGMNTIPIRNSSNSTTRHYPISTVSSPEQHASNAAFDILSAQTAPSGQSYDTISQNLPSMYAIVLYDFKAEKSDELTCHTGENIFVCAHHDYEWFIAKPIGRLGGPGLVPISFVSVIDINTGYATGNDVKFDIDSIGLPTVQEWKESIVKYKASNINLGSIEPSYEQYGFQQQQQQQHQQAQNNVPFNDQNRNVSQQSYNSVKEHSLHTEQEFIIDAAIESYTLEGGKYWFHMTCVTSRGFIRSLKRFYEDFYDLQVKVLEQFPKESGKILDKNGRFTERIVPYIPGPVPYVTESITKQRQEDLNLYVKDLTNLPIHMARCPLILNLFQVKNNNYDKEFLDSDNSVTINNVRSLNKSSSRGDIHDKTEKHGIDPRHTSSHSSRSSVEHPYHQQLRLSSQSSPYQKGGRSISNHSLLDFVQNSEASDSKQNKPNVSQNEDKTLTNTDIDKFKNMNLNTNSNNTGTITSQSVLEVKSQKIKFYYKDDIFALLIKSDITFDGLVEKISTRVDSDTFNLYLKPIDEESAVSSRITTDDQVKSIIESKQKIYIFDA